MRNAKSEDVLYTEAELLSCLDKVELIDYHTTVDLGGLSFYALNAGHVLGACMYFLDFLGGRSVLYTGDYSMEEDRHLMAAEVPEKKPDVLITEATYGVQVHASRRERSLGCQWNASNLFSTRFFPSSQHCQSHFQLYVILLLSTESSVPIQR